MTNLKGRVHGSLRVAQVRNTQHSGRISGKLGDGMLIIHDVYGNPATSKTASNRQPRVITADNQCTHTFLTSRGLDDSGVRCLCSVGFFSHWPLDQWRAMCDASSFAANSVPATK